MEEYRNRYREVAAELNGRARVLELAELIGFGLVLAAVVALLMSGCGHASSVADIEVRCVGGRTAAACAVYNRRTEALSVEIIEDAGTDEDRRSR
jgi:hypothetical protein